ncbi:FMN-linked oxidoreductase [Backusella circina FSU 941]|nr:FMN-linked oxidoreductase [Backusella circina FSU 941]
MVSSASSSAIFKPLKLGNQELKHRIVLAPMTRLRADKNAVPKPIMKDYYTQRASEGGLLISEATFISRTAGSFPLAPGIYTSEQIAAWKEITDSVHEKGGVIFLQLWHFGRAAIAECNMGKRCVSASEIAISGKDFFGYQHEVPHAMTREEIKEMYQEYCQAAKNAMEAGFDGVEIHGAHGYLPDQFLNTSTNQRTDEYGGSAENRARFVLELVGAVAEAVGYERTAIRLSPFMNGRDTVDENPYETWTVLTKKMQELHPRLAYLHFVEPRTSTNTDDNFVTTDSLDPFRHEWKGPFISAGGYTYDRHSAFDMAEQTGNLIAFGRTFVANPDLVERLRNDWPLTKYDRNTFYTSSEVGYTDYSFYSHD